MPDRPPHAVPVERVRGERPVASDWRADGLARSRHTRLFDELVRPLEDYDADRARKICGEICRGALVDLAPALLLMPAAERRRAQVLGAFTLTLFDFAGQRGLEGDRLAEINRWEYRLEEALEGQPAGQPIFVLLAAEEARRPWSRQSLERLLSLARRQAMAGATHHPGHRFDRALAESLAAALLGERPPDAASEIGGAALTLARWRRATRSQGPPSPGELSAALTASPRGLPRPWRAAASYLRLAGRQMLAAPHQAWEEPGFGLLSRVVLLLRSYLPGR